MYWYAAIGGSGWISLVRGRRGCSGPVERAQCRPEKRSRMLAEPAVLALSLAYLGLLFAVAYVRDRHASAWSASSMAPAVYGLSLAIYCTSWTFYGAVGRASTAGIDFVLIYTGPALLILVGYPMLRKMVRLAKQHNVTSIAD